MDEHTLSFDEQAFRHQRPVAFTIGILSAAVLLAAVLLAEYLVGGRSPALYLYALLAFASAALLWRAKTLNQLWIGGTGGMLAAAAGYSTMVASFSEPDLWFFSTGLSLTFAVIVAFHLVWHYVVSTVLVWVVMASLGLPAFRTPFDYALGALVVTAAVGVGAFTIVLMRRTRLQAYRLQQTLHRLAHRDALTSLPNRRAFMDRLQGEAAQGPQNLHLLMLDLDDFKRVNDTLGHDVGDQALIAVGHAIALHAGALNHGRLGGEEFAVSARLEADAVRALAQGLVEACHTLVIEGRQLSVSIGVTGMHSGETPSQLLRRADEALYAAKHAGKNRYHVL